MIRKTHKKISSLKGWQVGANTIWIFFKKKTWNVLIHAIYLWVRFTSVKLHRFWTFHTKTRKNKFNPLTKRCNLPPKFTSMNADWTLLINTKIYCMLKKFRLSHSIPFYVDATNTKQGLKHTGHRSSKIMMTPYPANSSGGDAW